MAPGRASLRHGRLEPIVEDADAARLDEDVGPPRPGRITPRAIPLVVRGVDDDLRPRRIVDVAVLLTFVGVGLVERHAVSARARCAQ